VSCGAFDLRAAEACLTVRRAARWKKTPQVTAYRGPQKRGGEKCGLANIQSLTVLIRIARATTGGAE